MVPAARALALLCPLMLAPAAGFGATLDLAEPQVQAFAEEMAREHGFDRDAVRRLLAEAEHREDIVELMNRPAESKPWHAYRGIFLTPERIAAGAAFLEAHTELLQRIGTQYGVDPQVIVAIIGVETHYGRHLGRHRVIDALATLAFGYPKRAAFFRRELVQYLLLTQEEGFDPLALSGSYAGAMGQPQFIASSYRSYAVDGDGDGKRDLWQSPADIIASVANYLGRHGWQKGDPVALPARVEGQGYRTLLNDGLSAGATVAELRRRGVEPSADLDGAKSAGVIELEAEDGAEHWVALPNFYVITRYNRSPKYAMAVYQLGRAIQAQARTTVQEPTTGGMAEVHAPEGP